MKGQCCSCQTSGSTNRTVSVMTRMSAPANAVSTPMNAMSAPMNAMSTPMNAMSTPMNAMSTPMNAMSMKSVGQGYGTPSSNQMGQTYQASEINQMNSMHSQLMNETTEDSMNESQMVIEQMEEPYAGQSRMAQVSPSKQISFMDKPIISRMSQNMSYTGQSSQVLGSARGSSCAPSGSFQRQSSIRHQRIPSSTISSRSSYQNGNLGCTCGRPTCPSVDADGYARIPAPLSIPSAAGSIIEQPTRDCDGPCPCTGADTGPTPSRMFGRSSSFGMKKSGSVFRVLPGSYNNTDCKKPCDVVEPEAICLPCGHTFPEGPRDTTWRVKIMKDLGSQTTGFDHGIQTQTSETRVVTAKKLEEILPDTARYIPDDPNALCNCNDALPAKETNTSNCIIRRLESFGELSRTKSGCQNNLRFTSDGCKNPPHIIEASTNTHHKTRLASPKPSNKKKCKGPCCIM